MEFDYTCQPGLKDWALDYIKTGKPFLSIITAFYNDTRLLPQTAQCVKNQTFPFFEWIIVDDGSTEDGSTVLLSDLEQSDSRIRVLHKENGGLSSARNYGLRYAHTDLFVPLDSDDLIEPTFLEYCWWMLQKNPDASWAYSTSLGFGAQEYLWDAYFDPIRMKADNHLTATALIRKKAFLEIGGYLEQTHHFNEDWYAWLKLIANGAFPAQATGEYLFWYRRSNSRMLANVRTDGKMQKENALLLRSAAKRISNPHNPIIFPTQGSQNSFFPKFSSWSLPFSTRLAYSRILFIFSNLDDTATGNAHLHLLSELTCSQLEIGIITTDPSRNELQQHFREFTPNIFNLPNFLSPENYAEFISYYIQSRQVNMLALGDTALGYSLLPWLRQHFPNLQIVDIRETADNGNTDAHHKKYCDSVSCIVERTYIFSKKSNDTPAYLSIKGEESIVFVDSAKTNLSAFLLQENKQLGASFKAIQTRREKAQALLSLNPLSSQFYASMLQLYVEHDLRTFLQSSKETAKQKLVRALREQGFGITIKRAFRWLCNKIQYTFKTR